MDAERMYNRQQQRGDLAAQWLDALELKQGDVVIDVGCGPGLFSLMAAERVGPEGLVCAVDSSAEALEFLRGLQEEQGAANIQRVHADAVTMAPPERLADAALVTFMLHHDPNGGALLQNVARMLKAGARAVVAEFDPEGPCEKGPDRERRLALPVVRDWCEAAGLRVERLEQQTPEHYLLIVVREAIFTKDR